MPTSPDQPRKSQATLPLEVPLVESDLEEFARSSTAQQTLKSLLSPAEFAFVEHNSNAFLFGLIADQSVKAEAAWSLPLKLSDRLGSIEIETLLATKESGIEAAIRKQPSLHRYPSQIAKSIYAAAIKLFEEFDGSAAGIWPMGTRASQVRDRLMQFRGIGPKKAALGLMLLIRDIKVPLEETGAIDIAYDVHVRRVFLRAGLVQEDSISSVTGAARTMRPDYPGSLTTPVWIIGRTWCHASSPNCKDCPLRIGCPKLISMAEGVRS